MSDETDIMNAISPYFHLLDDRRPEPWGELLTVDVVIHLYDPVIGGRDDARRDIFGGQVSGQHGKHIAVNPYITVTDELVKVDGAWLFKKQRIDVELHPLQPE
jgi:hypothetical protein